MDKEGKGFNRYSLIVKITKIFNENNFSKVQKICTFIVRENFPNPYPPCEILRENWDIPPSPLLIARYLNTPLGE